MIFYGKDQELLEVEPATTKSGKIWQKNMELESRGGKGDFASRPEKMHPHHGMSDARLLKFFRFTNRLNDLLCRRSGTTRSRARNHKE